MSFLYCFRYLVVVLPPAVIGMKWSRMGERAPFKWLNEEMRFDNWLPLASHQGNDYSVWIDLRLGEVPGVLSARGQRRGWRSASWAAASRALAERARTPRARVRELVLGSTATGQWLQLITLTVYPALPVAKSPSAVGVCAYPTPVPCV